MSFYWATVGEFRVLVENKIHLMARILFIWYGRVKCNGANYSSELLLVHCHLYPSCSWHVMKGTSNDLLTTGNSPLQLANRILARKPESAQVHILSIHTQLSQM